MVLNKYGPNLVIFMRSDEMTQLGCMTLFTYKEWTLSTKNQAKYKLAQLGLVSYPAIENHQSIITTQGRPLSCNLPFTFPNNQKSLNKQECDPQKYSHIKEF